VGEGPPPLIPHSADLGSRLNPTSACRGGQHRPPPRLLDPAIRDNSWDRAPWGARHARLFSPGPVPTMRNPVQLSHPSIYSVAPLIACNGHEPGQGHSQNAAKLRQLSSTRRAVPPRRYYSAWLLGPRRRSSPECRVGTHSRGDAVASRCRGHFRAAAGLGALSRRAAYSCSSAFSRARYIRLLPFLTTPTSVLYKQHLCL